MGHGIIIFLAVAISLLLLVRQGKEVSYLKAEIARERETVAVMERSSTRSGVQKEAGDSPEVTSPGEGAQRFNPAMMSQLLALIPDKMPERNGVEGIRLLPDVLTFLENFSADDLFVVLEELYELRGDQSRAKSDKAELIVGVLFLLLADIEPERVLALLEEQDSDDHTVNDFQSSALFSLGQQDPAKAEAYLDSLDWSGKLREKGELAVLAGWIETDFEKFLQYFEKTELSPEMEMPFLANGGRKPKVKSEMKKALVQMEESPMKEKLFSALMAAEYTDQGFAGVSQLLSEMTFANAAKRDAVLSGASNIGLWQKPKETIEWLEKEVSPARRGKFLADGIGHWAHQDYQAAGEWLMTQEPSSDTDKVISSYAATVVQLEPAAAMTWADEIQDEKVQERTRKSSLQKWHKTDPDAARNWVVEQGWEVEKWLPNSNESP